MSGTICMVTRMAPAFHSMGSQAMVRLIRRESPWCFHTATAKGTPMVMVRATSQIHTVLAVKPVRVSAAARAIDTTTQMATTRLASEPRPSRTQASAISTDLRVDGAAPRRRIGLGVGRERRGGRGDGSGPGPEREAAGVTNSDGSTLVRGGRSGDAPPVGRGACFVIRRTGWAAQWGSPVEVRPNARYRSGYFRPSRLTSDLWTWLVAFLYLERSSRKLYDGPQFFDHGRSDL